MPTLISFIAHSPEVLVFALLIAVSAGLAYRFWFRPAVREVMTGVKDLEAALSQTHVSWTEASQRVHHALKAHPHLSSIWLETQGRVVDIYRGESRGVVMFGSPKDLWNVPTLMGRRLNFGLADTVPNLLVGVGLFFTFVFLSWALVDTTGVLTAVNASVQQTETAISDLLQVAGGKFLTSLTGLLTSMVWTFMSKRELNALARTCDNFLDALAHVVPNNGSEMVLCQQLDVNVYGLGVTEDLLATTREQTGLLQRLESGLTAALAGAITQSFSPQLETMTLRLTQSIDHLADKLGTMNQEAIQKMLADFSTQLQRVTQSEMVQLRQTLTELTQRLETAGVSFGAGATQAAQAIDQVSEQLVARMDTMTQNLTAGATHLQTVSGSWITAMKELDAVLREASGVGRQEVVLLNQTLDRTGQTLDTLEQVATGLSTAAESLVSVSGHMGQIVHRVSALSIEQQHVIEAVRDVAPHAMLAVERMTTILDETGRQTRLTMETAAATLTQTVTSITEGVTTYTHQVAQLHRMMDTNLAKAVGSFDTGINELTESIETLSEVMQASSVAAPVAALR